MAVFRVEKTKDFTIMSNHHLRNTELSLKAKGLLSLMLSLPEDWDYTTKGLAHICKDGVDSITTALKELERHGYLTRQRLRYDNGQLGDIEYTIHEQPVSTENTGLSRVGGMEMEWLSLVFGRYFPCGADFFPGTPPGDPACYPLYGPRPCRICQCPENQDHAPRG